MADTASLRLAVGDRVVYPNQGLCKVTGIDTKEVAGQKLPMVSLLRVGGGAKVMVPQAKVVAIGVRKVSSAAEVDKVLDFIRSDSDKASLDWKARARTNVERMSTGGLLGLAEVVKGLCVLSELRPLPTKERELYNDARHLLIAEIAASLGMQECDAEDSVDIVLFPPGRDRPKRTAAEFTTGLEDGDDLGLDGDLLGLDGADLEAPVEEEAPAEEESAEASEDSDSEDAPAAKKGKKAKAAELLPSLLSDDDETQPQGTALIPADQLPPKRKRGRPPKIKPPEAVGAAPAEPPAPKKRG